jgi:hypothetical protein
MSFATGVDKYSHGEPPPGLAAPDLRNAAEQSGGFLIRLASFAHLDNQSESEKKQNAIRKPSARNDQIRGSFWFTAVGGSFFSDTRTSEWPVWPQNGTDGAHQAHTVCLC